MASAAGAEAEEPSGEPGGAEAAEADADAGAAPGPVAERPSAGRAEEPDGAQPERPEGDGSPGSGGAEVPASSPRGSEVYDDTNPPSGAGSSAIAQSRRTTARFWRRMSGLRQKEVRKAQPQMDPELALYRNMDNKNELEVEEAVEDDDDPLSKALRYVRAQRELLKSGSPGIVEEETRLKVWVETEELEMLLKEEVMQQAVRRWIRFDVVFGLVICMNGIFMGLTTQDIVDESSISAQIVETVFLVIFIIEWCIRWYYKPTGLKGMLKDPWSAFDLIIIVVSFVDTVILGSLDLKSGASLLTALRIVRLFRLVRLVRLFKLLKKLWMLVSGMMESFRILFWSLIMMSLFCYIFGLFLLEVVRTSGMLNRKPEAEIRWGSVGRCMLTMAEIATHNGQDSFLELSQEIGMWTFFIIIVFVFIASLGLLNLVIAVQMTSSLHLAKKDDLYEDIIARVMRHRSLRRLREILNDRCIVQTGSQMLRRGMLLKWVNDQRPVDLRSKSDLEIPSFSGSRRDSPSFLQSEAFKDEIVENEDEAESSFTRKMTDFGNYLSRQPKRKAGLARDFEDAGLTEDEVNMIFTEIDVINGVEKSVHLDEFIDSCMLLTSNVRELDFVSLLQSVQSLHQRLSLLKSSMNDTLRAIDESGEQVHALLKKYHVPASGKDEIGEEGEGDEDEDFLDDVGKVKTQQNLDEPGDELAREVDLLDADARQKAFFRTEQETLLAAQETNRLTMRQNWANFDLVFALVVVLNTATLGVEAVTASSKVRDIRNPDFDTVSMVWFVVENFFTLVYISELTMRVIFMYQMTVQNDFRTCAYVFPKLLILMDRKIIVSILASFPTWLRDLRNFMLLDTVVIVTGLFDNMILRFASVGGDYSKFLKLVGLLRLLRMARLLKLIRPLSVLLGAFMVNVKIIFWSLVMLVSMIYAGAITMVELLGRDKVAAQDPVVQRCWSHVGTAMLTLGEMVTYTNWRDHITAVDQQGAWIWIASVVFIGITSMGILNLVTGVMVQAAFNTVVNVNHHKLLAKLTDAKQSIQDAIRRAVAKESALAEKEKAELQRNVNWMRQTMLQTDAAAQLRESKRLSDLGLPAFEIRDYMNFRRSRNVGMATTDQLAQVARGILDEEAEGGDNQRRSKSTLDKRNHCTVSHAFWTSDGELCLGIVAQTDSARPRVTGRDPMCAVLIWDSGRTNPLLFVPDVELTDQPGSARASEHEGTIGKTGQKIDKPMKESAGELTEKPQGGKRSTFVGDLYFGKVPMGTDLQFQWGTHFTIVKVFPVRAFMAFDREIRLADVLPIDQEVLTIKMLRTLVQDPVFIRSLAHISIRPEQALLTYATLNVIYTGRVRTVDFVDGLMRVRRLDVGLDTAGAKSLLRRLYLQAGQLSKDAVTCNMCFSSMVQTLHGVSILEQDCNDDNLHMVDEDAATLDRQRAFAQQNQKLRTKIDRLHAYVKRRRAELGVKGDLGFGRAPVEADDEEEEEISITSASPGWD